MNLQHKTSFIAGGKNTWTSINNFKNTEGVKWRDYKKQIKTPYYRLYLVILFIFCMIALGIYCYIKIESLLLDEYKFVLIPIFGVYFGFFLHAYSLFFHEASHNNLCSNSMLNNLLANCFITPFVGLPLTNYRKSHWLHHLHIGTAQDTEISYIDPINTWTVLQKMIGLYQIQTFFRYFANFSKIKANSKNRNYLGSLALILALLVWIFVQGFIIYQMATKLSIGLSITWFWSVFFVFPLVGSLRQTLEHRCFNFDAATNRATNRMFGTSIFAGLFGAAGFNRHLLHHWDPQLSYLNFDEMESFFKDTEIEELLLECKISYFACFKKLVSY